MKWSIIIILALLVLSCSNDSTNPESNSDQHSIVGKILDKASNQGISGSLVKIANDKNAYQTVTGAGGSFSFQDIASGEYVLTTELSHDNKVVVDTCGKYSTTVPDWGTIYSNIFASITGTIRIEDETDYSLINVQLLGTDKSALTTNKGKFRIDFIFPDTYDLYITKDKNFNEIKIKDIRLSAGQILEVDTLLTYKFKPLKLIPRDDLSFLSDAYTGFCYYNGYFYFTGNDGIYRYNPANEEKTKVYDHYYIGKPHLTYDYTENVWISGDEMSNSQYRKFSLPESVVIDSVKFDAYNDELAWDPTNNSLISVIYAPTLVVYSFDTHTTTRITPEIKEFDPADYKRLSFNNIFIDPEGKIYVTVLVKDNYDHLKTYLCVWDNLKTMNLLKIYKFPTNFHYLSSLSYYDGKIYTVNYNDRIVYEIAF